MRTLFNHTNTWRPFSLVADLPLNLSQVCDYPATLRITGIVKAADKRVGKRLVVDMGMAVDGLRLYGAGGELSYAKLRLWLLGAMEDGG